MHVRAISRRIDIGRRRRREQSHPFRRPDDHTSTQPSTDRRPLCSSRHGRPIVSNSHRTIVCRCHFCLSIRPSRLVHDGRASLSSVVHGCPFRLPRWRVEGVLEQYWLEEKPLIRFLRYAGWLLGEHALGETSCEEAALLLSSKLLDELSTRQSSTFCRHPEQTTIQGGG